MIKKLIFVITIALLLLAIGVTAYAADDEVVLSPNDATLPDAEFISNAGADDATLVSTEKEGFYAEWKNVPASVKVKLKYDNQFDDEDKNAKISLYVNGKFAVKIPIPHTGSWWDKFPESEAVDVNIPEGATIRLQLDEGDRNANIRSVILVKGTPKVEDETNPETGDLSTVMYMAMAGIAGGALILRKRTNK